MLDSHRILSVKEVYATYGRPFTRQWLDKGRRLGTGPAYFKSGDGATAMIYYRVGDIEAWIESRRQPAMGEK